MIICIFEKKKNPKKNIKKNFTLVLRIKFVFKNAIGSNQEKIIVKIRMNN